MTHQQPILPMTLRERFGCLAVVAVMAGFWVFVLLSVYQCGQPHPRNPRAIVTQQRPSVEIRP